MKTIAVTQRIERVIHASGEVELRDALDQAWPAFLAAAGCMAIPLPNHIDLALRMMRELPIDGLLLTGGETLALYGGDSPERDAVEKALLAQVRGFPTPLPVIGVCRGMHVIQDAFGVILVPVEGHVTACQVIDIEGAPATVNAYHRWGAHRSPAPLEVWAHAPDGVIKAVRHRTEPLVGIMWHPERRHPFDQRDLDLFASVFTDPEEAAA